MFSLELKKAKSGAIVVVRRGARPDSLRLSRIVVGVINCDVESNYFARQFSEQSAKRDFEQGLIAIGQGLGVGGDFRAFQ